MPEENANGSSTTLNLISNNSSAKQQSEPANQLNNKLSASVQQDTTPKLSFDTLAANANIQSNFYQSVFATPQSMTATPQIASTKPTNNNLIQTPPPLPPMPAKYTTPSLYQQTPVLNTNIYQTQLANGGVILSTPHTNNLLSSPALTSSTSNTNETFEQKWARIQAAKKTNPFAEDIAKKFEIKL